MLALTVFADKATGEEKIGQTVFESQSYIRALSSPLIDTKRTLQSIIVSTAVDYSLDPSLFLRIAVCESGLKPDAKNTASTASGIFQFLDSTFSSQMKKYQMTGEKNDPLVQIELAAKMIADGGLSHWNASKHCWQPL